MASGFIPEEEIVNLIEGSYEQLSARLEKAVHGSAESLFGGELNGYKTSDLRVAGTFKGYAIVQTEDRSKVFRVKYEIAENKEVLPLSAEHINLKTYTHSEYAKSQAKAFVENFLSGARTAAGENFKKILPSLSLVEMFVPAEHPQTPTEEEKIKDALAAERTWKKIFESKLAQIKSSISEDLQKIEDSKLHPKFRKLYDGSLSESEVKVYSNLVTSDVKYLSDRLSKIVASTEAAVKAQNGSVPALKESTDETLKQFEAFSTDFLSDVKSLSNSLSESQNVVNTIDSLAKIYDLLASELHSYEVAGRFIERMSNSLQATTEEG